ncbi:hypothetical protein MTO96_003180 [Rhipicephalus appendiculatus]
MAPQPTKLQPRRPRSTQLVEAHLVRTLAAAKANGAPRDFFFRDSTDVPEHDRRQREYDVTGLLPVRALPPAGLLPVHANSRARKRTFVGAATTPEGRDIQSRACSQADVHTGEGERNGSHEKERASSRASILLTTPSVTNFSATN